MNGYSVGNQPQSGNGYYYPQQNNMGGMVPQPKQNKGLIIAVCMAVVAIAIVIVIVILNLGKKEQSSSNKQEVSKTKTITCSLTRDASGYGMGTSTVSVTFDENGTKPLSISQIFSISMDSSASESSVSYMLAGAQEECEEYREFKGVTCNTNLAGHTVSQTITADLTVANANDMESMGLDMDELMSYNYDSFKSGAESMGATCQ